MNDYRQIANEYISAESIIGENMLPEKTRMAGVVWRCIAAVQIAFGVPYREMKGNVRHWKVVAARYAVIMLIQEHTRLGNAEIEKVLNMSQGNCTRITRSGSTAPAVTAMLDTARRVYAEMVRVEYDKEIPF